MDLSKTGANSPRIVLASQSPRRIELLTNLGLKFEVIPSNIDEQVAHDDPSVVVVELARAKAESVAASLRNGGGADPERTLVICADTVVVIGQDIIGKPNSREEAYQTLMRMSGRPHKVFTGVSIVDLPTGSVDSRFASSTVFFRSLDPAEVRCYVKTSEPMDKAGSYALQGIAAAFVEKVEGCYTNIIGLPVPLTLSMLRDSGLCVLGLP